MDSTKTPAGGTHGSESATQARTEAGMADRKEPGEHAAEAHKPAAPGPEKSHMHSKDAQPGKTPAGVVSKS